MATKTQRKSDVVLTLEFPVPDALQDPMWNEHNFFMRWIRESLLAHPEAQDFMAGLLVSMTVDHGQVSHSDGRTSYSSSIGSVVFPKED